jgi:hypothetical protein
VLDRRVRRRLSFGERWRRGHGKTGRK